MNNLINKVEYFLKEYNITKENEPLLVAFSGGFDSMCLLDICTKLGLNVIAIHLNHNWRGEESKQEEDWCEEFCRKNNIKFYSETLPKDTQKTETVAREARYKFFENCAKKFNSKIILTAHNANDNAETLIYRIAKGTGVCGLAGINPNRDIYYRPLINIKRAEIEEYCKENSLTPNNDSSNLNTKYKRNLIRHNILPELSKINPQVVETINSLSQTATMDNEIVELYLKSLTNPFDTENFIKYPYSVKSRLIYKLFLENNLEYDRKKIDRVIDFIEQNKTAKSGKTISLNSDLLLFISTKEIKVVHKLDTKDIEIRINQCGEYKINDLVFSITEFREKVNKYPQDKEKIAYVNLENIQNLHLRTRKDGDVITPLGCKGSQKLKKYLNEKKIPQHEKNQLLLLATDNEILWVPSVGMSDKIKVVTTPTHMLKLTDN